MFHFPFTLPSKKGSATNKKTEKSRGRDVASTVGASTGGGGAASSFRVKTETIEVNSLDGIDVEDALSDAGGSPSLSVMANASTVNGSSNNVNNSSNVNSNNNRATVKTEPAVKLEPKVEPKRENDDIFSVYPQSEGGSGVGGDSEFVKKAIPYKNQRIIAGKNQPTEAEAVQVRVNCDLAWTWFTTYLFCLNVFRQFAIIIVIVALIYY